MRREPERYWVDSYEYYEFEFMILYASIFYLWYCMLILMRIIYNYFFLVILYWGNELVLLVNMQYCGLKILLKSWDNMPNLRCQSYFELILLPFLLYSFISLSIVPHLYRDRDFYVKSINIFYLKIVTKETKLSSSLISISSS